MEHVKSLLVLAHSFVLSNSFDGIIVAGFTTTPKWASGKSFSVFVAAICEKKYLNRKLFWVSCEDEVTCWHIKLISFHCLSSIGSLNVRIMWLCESFLWKLPSRSEVRIFQLETLNTLCKSHSWPMSKLSHWFLTKILSNKFFLIKWKFSV